jgi:predicted MPP superfamily phosphohydrolase
LTIVQLSDIHIGPFMSGEELREYVDAVNRLKPDLVALTGDFVTGSPNEASPCIQALSLLTSRLGVFACLGNHDIYAGAAGELIRGFAENGIRMLRNDAAVIDIGNSNVAVSGIDDIGRGRPSLRRTLDARSRPSEVNVLLSHRPEIFPRAAREGMDLILSGHYHGGQVKLLADPQALSIARFMTSYADGFFTLDGPGKVDGVEKKATLFVSRGIGVTALPIRINCPPQIAHLTLIKA